MTAQPAARPAVAVIEAASTRASPNRARSAQHTANAADGANTDGEPAGAASSIGPSAEACTVSSRPGHSALNGPNTSPVTATRTHPDSPGGGCSPTSAPRWHQSLRTTEPAGVHQRQPCRPAVDATASWAAAASRLAPPPTATGPPTSPSPGTLSPETAAPSQIERKPADAAASACARAPLTNNACAPSTTRSTDTIGHTISNGSTSPRSSRLRRPR